MENTNLKQLKLNTNELLHTIFRDNIINYELSYKKYEEDDFMGSFDKGSMEDLEPKIYLNEDIDYLLDTNGIYDSRNKGYVKEDTILHEYGHTLYELVENTDDGLIDRVNDFLREELDNEIEMDENEDGDFEIVRKGQEGKITVDEDELIDYLEYEAEELFAEGFAMYVRLKVDDKKYLEVNPNIDISKKMEDFFSIVLEQIIKIKEELFEDEEEIKYKRLKGITYSGSTIEDENEVTIYKDNVKIGKCSYSVTDIDSFVEYEIINYVEERTEDGELGEEGREEFYNFKELIEDKGEVYQILYFEIEKEYRGKGYGEELFKNTLIEIDKKIEYDNDMLYLNASPSYDGMPLTKLTNFYKKMGFSTSIEQGTNNLMSVLDLEKIKEVIKDKNTVIKNNMR